MDNFVNATYIVSGLLFIFALAGLSRFETSKRGIAFGILGMVLALTATIASVISPETGEGLDSLGLIMLVGAVGIGAVIGIRKALTVEMTGMPELIALLHSFVGLAAVLVGYNSWLEGSHDKFHLAEVYFGIFIGAVTFTGSIVAWGKLSERIPSRPLVLPFR
ncbi:MAG: NAD(P)(+) transhydrogenase (Re/Si-specific) subunit beta, partial [Actinomycetes bacterium]|nr:NAD(P)(+) transhydrogenase (Re/Si-specific) subunit beta [Actinomycetes bacterium]MDX5379728.1 NAD(P)(+) transhydrogenase (Re/Si-specific) subunit beta [Actinomycetes bacterium]MDX5398129.1 NAD(P)(+) transhydrogenase (Re/Si-specific) subunit beta [Actinomycetes bacterium]MDX5449425.1 NAD(P)(+) transhydrogenase (Re/Si-specific) subunit beta [Actinomycetes bacterium]